jgi:hypothetical protein
MAISKLPPPLLKLLLLSSPQRNNETFDVLVPFKLQGASLPTALSTSRTHIPSSKPNIHKKKKLQKASEQAKKHKSSTEKQISITSKQKERKITQEHCYCFAPDEEEEVGAGRLISPYPLNGSKRHTCAHNYNENVDKIIPSSSIFPSQQISLSILARPVAT